MKKEYAGFLSVYHMPCLPKVDYNQRQLLNSFFIERCQLIIICLLTVSKYLGIFQERSNDELVVPSTLII